MKTIEKAELYEHLSKFLQTKGIELKEGSYTKGIHAGCSLLADAINLSQTGLERAKSGLDKKLDQVRQVIHEKTAPKSNSDPAPASAAPPKAPKPTAVKSAPRKSAKTASKQSSSDKRKRA